MPSTPASGLPLSVMAIDLLEIGAGGGSIARTNIGLIRVGPDSAGADPGPVCYGRGGTQPTLTDANLLLGYLNPGFFNGGARDIRHDGQSGRGDEKIRLASGDLILPRRQTGLVAEQAAEVD